MRRYDPKQDKHTRSQNKPHNALNDVQPPVKDLRKQIRRELVQGDFNLCQLIFIHRQRLLRGVGVRGDGPNRIN